MTKTLTRTISNAAAACALAALLAVSCSEAPPNSERVVRKLVRAHGGARKIERLDAFTGKGFIKDLSDTVVVKSNAFDVYRAGERYKHVIYRTSTGRLGDVIVLCRNEEGVSTWRSRGGLLRVSSMELELLRYRFPMVLSWIREEGRALEVSVAGTDGGEVHLRCRHEDLFITLAVDRSTWLLDGVEIRSATDSTFVFSERYDTYMNLDGIPFPQRHRASYRGQPLYEYILSVVEAGRDLPDSTFSITEADTARTGR